MGPASPHSHLWKGPRGSLPSPRPDTSSSSPDWPAGHPSRPTRVCWLCPAGFERVHSGHLSITSLVHHTPVPGLCSLHLIALTYSLVCLSQSPFMDRSQVWPLFCPLVIARAWTYHLCGWNWIFQVRRRPREMTQLRDPQAQPPAKAGELPVQWSLPLLPVSKSAGW